MTNPCSMGRIARARMNKTASHCIGSVVRRRRCSNTGGATILRVVLTGCLGLYPAWVSTDEPMRVLQGRLRDAVRPLVEEITSREPRAAYEGVTSLVEAARQQLAELSEVRALSALQLWESLGQPTLAEFARELGVSTPRAHQLLATARRAVEPGLSPDL